MTDHGSVRESGIKQCVGEAPAALRVAITSPFVWPWVRRGSERLLHDLSRYLLGNGHHVSVYSTGPEDGREDRDGVVYHLLRQRWRTGLRQFNCCHDFAFRLQAVLERCDADVVFCMNYFDAYAAIRARRHSGATYRVVFHSAGILSRRHFRAVPLDAWFFRTVRREASLTLAVSHFAGSAFKDSFGIEPAVVAPPVVVENFSMDRGEDPPESALEPRVMFVGDADERRKGARALCRAFALVRERHPQAQLLFNGHVSSATRQALLDICARAGTSDHVAFLGVGRVEDLPTHYRGAAVTVLPAIAEAFGMALAESLAAGTPVVGARHGGITEIIDDDLIGRLFDPGDTIEETSNIRGLADAILQVLARGKTPEVVAACRTKAQRYSWAVLGPEYERLLQRVVAGDQARRNTPDDTRP